MRLLEEELARLRGVEEEVVRLGHVEKEVVTLRAAAAGQRERAREREIRAAHDSTQDQLATLALEQQVLQQRREALVLLQREVNALAASGVEDRARVMRSAEEDCARLGGLQDVMSVNQGLRHKVEVLEALLVESEKRVTDLERDKEEALAQAHSLVEDMVELERGVHVEGRVEGRHGPDAFIQRMVGHERKIAALERQIRSKEAEHIEEIHRTRQLFPLKQEAKIIDLEQQLARARVQERSAAEAMAPMERVMLSLLASVEALERGAEQLQVVVTRI